jgi:inner membrane protein
MAAARLGAERDVPRRRLALGRLVLSALSLAPDLDVVAFALGVRYHAPWGHRGAVHSLALTAAAGVLLGASMKWLSGSRLRGALVAGAVAASHPLLDAFTDGGLGTALLWPFTNERFFAPWRPIPVAPIGTAFLSARGLHVLATEVLFFAPLLLLALWPRRGRRSHGVPANTVRTPNEHSESVGPGEQLEPGAPDERARRPAEPPPYRP